MKVWVIQYVSPDYGNPRIFHSIWESEEKAKEHVECLDATADFGYYIYFECEVQR